MHEILEYVIADTEVFIKNTRKKIVNIFQNYRELDDPWLRKKKRSDACVWNAIIFMILKKEILKMVYPGAQHGRMFRIHGIALNAKS